MRKIRRRENKIALRGIKKDLRLLRAVVAFVIVTLIAVIVRYLYEPVSSLLNFLPDISITLVVGTAFFLSLVGLYLSSRISGQTARTIEDYGNRLERILTITRDLKEEVHGDLLLEKFMDHALSITHSEAGSILLSEKGEGLRFKIVRGEKSHLLVGTSVERGKGFAGWVAEKGEPLRVHDVSGDARFDPDFDLKTGFRTKSVLCVPLKTKSGVIGVIELLNKRGGHPFRGTDEEILTYLADQVAVSVIKTKFYEDQKNYEIHLTELLLGTIDVQIPEKAGHSRRVATYCNIVARALNMSEEEKKKLHFACLLHDVGFLKMRSEEVYKKEEFMKHPVIGYEMVNPINFYSDIAPFILHHHERYDGFGYPSRLKGEEIPLEARIIAIAEAFDAMISRTSYRIPVDFNEAKEEIRRNAGTQFDPGLVAVFVEKVPSNIFEKVSSWPEE